MDSLGASISDLPKGAFVPSSSSAVSISLPKPAVVLTRLPLSLARPLRVSCALSYA